MKSLNSMTFQGFHDLYEPFRGWGRGMTIERGVGDLKDFIFQAWKVMEFNCWSLKVMEKLKFCLIV